MNPAVKSGTEVPHSKAHLSHFIGAIQVEASFEVLPKALFAVLLNSELGRLRGAWCIFPPN